MIILLILLIAWTVFGPFLFFNWITALYTDYEDLIRYGKLVIVLSGPLVWFIWAISYTTDDTY